MRITQNMLRKIIKEEIEAAINEAENYGIASPPGQGGLTINVLPIYIKIEAEKAQKGTEAEDPAYRWYSSTLAQGVNDFIEKQKRYPNEKEFRDIASNMYQYAYYQAGDERRWRS